MATFSEDHFKKERVMRQRSSQGFGLQNLSAEKAQEVPVYASGSSQIEKQENSPLHILGLMTCLCYEGQPDADN